MPIRPDLFAGVLPFVRTAEERSFGRAAASLGITTAAVSKAISKLEGDLGVKLLDRSSRKVALTREGAIFLERCQHAVLGVQGAREAMQEARREPQGELAVTLPFILAPFVVTDLVRLSTQYPRLSFRLHVSDRMARLADESYDVAIRVGELAAPSQVSRLLRKTRWVTVASPSYLRRAPAPTTPAELVAHDCLRFVGSNGKPRAWEFSDGDRAVTGSLLVDHGEYLLGAAISGMGICQVLDFMVAEPVRDGALVEVLADHATDGPGIHAIATASRARSASVRAFIRFLVEAFRR
jgi:DNA-binding transcriptional LysR family regulator